MKTAVATAEPDQNPHLRLAEAMRAVFAARMFDIAARLVISWRMWESNR